LTVGSAYVTIADINLEAGITLARELTEKGHQYVQNVNFVSRAADSEKCPIRQVRCDVLG
jgi:hypothetical protein